MHFSNACKMIRLENCVGGDQKGFFFEKMLVPLYHSTICNHKKKSKHILCLPFVYNFVHDNSVHPTPNQFSYRYGDERV